MSGPGKDLQPALQPRWEENGRIVRRSDRARRALGLGRRDRQIAPATRCTGQRLDGPRFQSRRPQGVAAAPGRDGPGLGDLHGSRGRSHFRPDRATWGMALSPDESTIALSSAEEPDVILYRTA